MLSHTPISWISSISSYTLIGYYVVLYTPICTLCFVRTWLYTGTRPRTPGSSPSPYPVPRRTPSAPRWFRARTAYSGCAVQQLHIVLRSCYRVVWCVAQYVGMGPHPWLVKGTMGGVPRPPFSPPYPSYVPVYTYMHCMCTCCAGARGAHLCSGGLPLVTVWCALGNPSLHYVHNPCCTVVPLRNRCVGVHVLYHAVLCCVCAHQLSHHVLVACVAPHH